MAAGIATVTSLTSSPNPSRPLQSVTFAATVSPSSGTITPTGTVTFFDGTTALGTGTLDNTGKATLATSGLPPGSNSITAQYSRDATYAPSTSAVLTQVGSLANGTTMSLSSSEDPSTFGDAVTFTAAVTVSLATPTGTVIFLDGTTTLGTGTLDNTGSATYQTSSLAQGSHSITAQYGGNGTYAGNTSNPLTQKVLPQVTALGNAAITVSGAAGSGTDELVITPATQTWTAQANDSWLYLANTSTSGIGSALIQFSYDANPNNTVRTGTFTIAGVTLTVTQAGSNYAAAAPLVPLTANPLVGAPWQITLDQQGHIFYADTQTCIGSPPANCDYYVEEYTLGDTGPIVVASLHDLNPTGVAPDNQGSLYIAAASSQLYTVNLTSVFSAGGYPLTQLAVPGLNPTDTIALDEQGNLLAVSGASVNKWNLLTGQVTTVFTSSLAGAELAGVAVDAQGNIYVTDIANNLVQQWSPATQQLSTLVSSGLNTPYGVAVDGAGNVYIADTNNNALEQWNAGTQR